jgi:L-lactate dehydrogenase complex protein LldF
LLTWRREIVARGQLPWRKRLAMKLASAVLRRPWLYSLSARVARWTLRHAPRFLIYNRFNGWGRQRELPAAPRRSFRQLYRRR